MALLCVLGINWFHTTEVGEHNTLDLIRVLTSVSAEFCFTELGSWLVSYFVSWLVRWLVS